MISQYSKLVRIDNEPDKLGTISKWMLDRLKVKLVNSSAPSQEVFSPASPNTCAMGAPPAGSAILNQL